jgi:hypothetical protein
MGIIPEIGRSFYSEERSLINWGLGVGLVLSPQSLATIKQK